MSLHSECIPANTVGQLDRERMFALMDEYYENIDPVTFKADLQDKDMVLLLKDQTGVIQGFTTLKTYELQVEEKVVRLIFSGDTIIHKDYWGDVELHRAWIRTVYQQVDDVHPYTYWLLISKGYKTYRFLPVYFQNFYPHYDHSTPEFEKRIMDAFGKLKYDGYYHPERGVIALDGLKDFLKPGVADVSEKRLKDPHIQFFIHTNPGYLHGDELVCITRLHKDNLRSRGLKYLDSKESLET